MTVPNSRLVGGKKFMWDGSVYPTQDDAARAQASYARDGFETHTCEDEGRLLVYTRRVVRQVSEAKSN